MLEADDVGMVERGHDIEFSVLEPAVLQHLLDGDSFAGIDHRSLVDDAERAVADHALGGVRQGFLGRRGALRRLRGLRDGGGGEE